MFGSSKPKKPVVEKKANTETELQELKDYNFAELVEAKDVDKVRTQLALGNVYGQIGGDEDFFDENGLEVAIRQAGNSDQTMLNLILSHNNAKLFFENGSSAFKLNASIKTKNIEVFKKILNCCERYSNNLIHYDDLLWDAISVDEISIANYLLQKESVTYSNVSDCFESAISKNEMFILLMQNKNKFKPGPNIHHLISFIRAKEDKRFAPCILNLEVLFNQIPLGEMKDDTDLYKNTLARCFDMLSSTVSGGALDRIIKRLLDENIEWDKKKYFLYVAKYPDQDQRFYLLLDYLSLKDLLDMLPGEEGLMSALLRRPTFSGVSMVIDKLLTDNEVWTIPGIDRLLKSRINANNLVDVKKLLDAGVWCHDQGILRNLVSGGCGKNEMFKLVVSSGPIKCPKELSGAFLQASMQYNWEVCNSILNCSSFRCLCSVVNERYLNETYEIVLGNINAAILNIIKAHQKEVLGMLFEKIPSIPANPDWMSAAVKARNDEVIFLLLRQQEKNKNTQQSPEFKMEESDNNYFQSVRAEYNRTKRLSPSDLRCYKAAQEFVKQFEGMGWLDRRRMSQFINSLKALLDAPEFNVCQVIQLVDDCRDVLNKMNDSEFILSVSDIAKKIGDSASLNQFKSWIEHPERAQTAKEEKSPSQVNYSEMLSAAIKTRKTDIAMWLLSRGDVRPILEDNSDNSFHCAILTKNEFVFRMLCINPHVKDYLKTSENVERLLASARDNGFVYGVDKLGRLKKEIAESAAVSLASGPTMFGQSSSSSFSSSSLEVKDERPVTMYLGRGSQSE